VVVEVKPEDIAKESEHSHQVALFAWAAANVGNDPRLHFLFAVPNGATFGSTPKDRAIRGGKMKAEGLKTGVPDVCLPVPGVKWSPPDTGILYYHGLFIEMKKPAARLKRAPKHKWDTGGVDEEQTVWLSFLEQQGYKVAVCYSWYEAANEIKYYLTGQGLDDGG
jgi:hypothetical protein